MAKKGSVKKKDKKGNERLVKTIVGIVMALIMLGAAIAAIVQL